MLKRFLCDFMFMIVGQANENGWGMFTEIGSNDDGIIVHSLQSTIFPILTDLLDGVSHFTCYICMYSLCSYMR